MKHLLELVKEKALRQNHRPGNSPEFDKRFKARRAREKLAKAARRKNRK